MRERFSTTFVNYAEIKISKKQKRIPINKSSKSEYSNLLKIEYVIETLSQILHLLNNCRLQPQKQQSYKISRKQLLMETVAQKLGLLFVLDFNVILQQIN